MKPEIVHGSIFEQDCGAIVNPVNTAGVMGAGLALEFKKRFPRNFEIYADACRKGEVKVGKVHVSPPEFTEDARRWIVNFPTKDHFRDPSRMEWIEDGLDDMVEALSMRSVRSVALPALGCGLGGLKWKDVRSVMVSKLSNDWLRAVICLPRSP